MTASPFTPRAIVGVEVTFPRDELIARLRAHKTVGESPIEELEWLIDHGVTERWEIGTLPTRMDEPVDGLFVVLEGKFTIYIDRGMGKRKVAEWTPGDVAGVLPRTAAGAHPGLPEDDGEARARHARSRAHVQRQRIAGREAGVAR
jgi:hypothetical protein